MPELPEVETTVRDLKKEILGQKIEDVWSDFKKIIKKPKSFEELKKEIIKRKIENIERRGKNILFRLSNNKTLLIHQKLTGHLLLGKWKQKGEKWLPATNSLLEDPVNRFLHLIFWLDGGKMLALSDLRKFAKVELWDNKELEESEEFKNLGPEPLEKSFTFGQFKEILANQKTAKGEPRQRRAAGSEPRQRRGKIKQVLMDQNVIAGIGNIYSDEILWQAKVNPFKEIKRLSDKEIEKIYFAMKKILKKAIELKGESISDFRRISGEKGGFDLLRKVYRKQGEKCPRCKTIIKREKIGGRSAHFCPKCQP